MELIGTIAGYLASVFIVGGFVFKEIRTIRVLNMIGCMCFVVYGFLGSEQFSWPVIIPNGILTLVHLYYLLFKKS